jgi:hypothetical protein
MGPSNPLIAFVATPAFGRVVIEASDGKSYSADLSSFSRVHCYPQTFERWQAVAPDEAGLTLVWTSRFEVHVDQIIALADKIDASRRSA